MFNLFVNNAQSTKLNALTRTQNTTSLKYCLWATHDNHSERLKCEWLQNRLKDQSIAVARLAILRRFRFAACAGSSEIQNAAVELPMRGAPLAKRAELGAMILRNSWNVSWITCDKTTTVVTTAKRCPFLYKYLCKIRMTNDVYIAQNHIWCI